MKWLVFVSAMIIALLMVVCYACIVAASEADERAEQIFKEYMEYKKKHR